MEQSVLRLHAGEVAMVGYGSLLSVASVSRTLGQPYDGPFVFCCVEGWRRVWDVSMPNEAFYYQENGERIYPVRIVYLNVRQVANSSINCVVFVLNAGQLEAMHGREWIYQPAVVTADLRGVRIAGGEALIYVGRDEHLVHEFTDPRAAAIRLSYLRLVQRGLGDTDAAFRAEYRQSTDDVPDAIVVDDRLDPARPSPWASAGHSYTPEQ